MVKLEDINIKREIHAWVEVDEKDKTKGNIVVTVSGEEESIERMLESIICSSPMIREALEKALAHLNEHPHHLNEGDARSDGFTKIVKHTNGVLSPEDKKAMEDADFERRIRIEKIKKGKVVES